MIATSPISESGPWSLGTLIGLPLGVILLVAGLVIIVRLTVWTHRHPDHRDTSDAGMLRLGVVVATLVIAVGLLVGMYPYSSEYHQWRDVSGTAESIDKRLVSAGEGMSERFVITIDGQPFGVDDTRAAAANEGDTVNLRCKKEWQYAASDGWGCRWHGVTPATPGDPAISGG